MRHSFFIFICFLTAAFSTSAPASDEDYCSTKDLNGPALGAPRHQEKTTWCYAYTAADLISYKLGKKISAADVKLNDDKLYLKESSWFSRLMGPRVGGETKKALQATLEAGTCLESDFPSSHTLRRFDGSGKGPKHLTERLEEAESFVEKMRSRAQKDRESSLRGEKACGTPAIELPRDLSSGLEILDHLEIAQASDKANAIENYQKKICKNREKLVPTPEIVSWWGTPHEVRTTNKVMNELNTQLSKNNVVGIAFDANFLLKPSDISASRSPHGSTVVGRKKDAVTGKCLYRLRVNKGLCAPGKFNYDCEGEDVLVPENDLRENIFGYDYLK